jgi:t-SNARE complex subunit (syntaxin)
MTTSSHLLRLRWIVFSLIAAAAVILTGCDSPAGMVREIRKNLDAFRSSPNPAQLERLEKSFVRIDAAIKDLEGKEDFAQADLFRRQAMMLCHEYRASREAYLKWNQDQASTQISDASSK